MAVTFSTQPASNSLNAAYKPIVLAVRADQLPTGASAPCPAVIADIYVNGTYYASQSVTHYTLQTFPFTAYVYTFDIQDKIQECLDSSFVRMHTLLSDMESLTSEKYAVSVQVIIRESYIDTDGFTRFYGTPPTAATLNTAASSGTGTATSNTFHVLNAALQHKDSESLATHLSYWKESAQQTLQLSHRPNKMQSNVFGGGKYYVSLYDDDYIWWYGNSYTPAPWFVTLNVVYRNGSTASFGPIAYPATTTTANGYKVYMLNAGIKGLRRLIPNVNWFEIAEYEVIVGSFAFQAARQYYYVTPILEADRIRLFFLNNLGTYDGITLHNVIEVSKAESSTWQRTLPSTIGANKSYGGLNRFQPKQNDFFEGRNFQYSEADMPWLKELIGSPRAYVQLKGIDGQADSLLPVVIEDGEIVAMKATDRFEYMTTIKFRYGNERINLR